MLYPDVRTLLVGVATLTKCYPEMTKKDLSYFVAESLKDMDVSSLCQVIEALFYNGIQDRPFILPGKIQTFVMLSAHKYLAQAIKHSGI